MAKTLFEWDYSDYPGAKRYPHLFRRFFVQPQGKCTGQTVNGETGQPFLRRRKNESK